MTSQAETPTRWAIVLTAIGAGILMGFQVGKAPPMIATISAELGLDLVQAGFYMSLINGFAVLTGIAAGLLADNAGRRRIVIVGIGFLIGGNLIGAVAETATMLFLSRLMEALAFVAIVVSIPGIIVEATRQRDLNTALSAWSTYMPGGFALMMAATPLIATQQNWRDIWWLNAGLAAGWLVLFLIICRGVGAPPLNRRRFDGLGQVLRRPGPWLLGSAFMLYTIQWFGVLTWLPKMMQDVGLSVAEAGFGVAAVVGVNAIGAVSAGLVLKTGIPRWANIGFCSLLLGLLTLGILDADLPILWRLALAAIFSGVGGLLPGACLSGAAVHSPSPGQVGMTNGVIVQCTNFGSLIGPPAVAMLAASAGDFTTARWLTLAAGLGGVGIALMLRRVEGRI